MVLACVFVLAGCGKGSKRKEADCVFNLKQLGSALVNYESEKKHFPDQPGIPGLEELRKTACDIPQYFVCPSSPLKSAEPGASLTTSNCSYLYFGGLSPAAHPGLPVIMDLPGNHDGLIQFVRIDGSVANIKCDKNLSATEAVYRILGKTSGFDKDEQLIVDQAKAWDEGDKDGQKQLAALTPRTYVPRYPNAEADAVSRVFMDFCHDARIYGEPGYVKYATRGKAAYEAARASKNDMAFFIKKVQKVTFGGTAENPKATVEYTRVNIDYSPSSERTGFAYLSLINGEWKVDSVD